MLLRYPCLLVITALTVAGCQSASQSQSQPQSSAQESTTALPGAMPSPSPGSELPQAKTQKAGNPAQGTNADGGGAADAQASATSPATNNQGETTASEAEQAEALDAQLDESLAVFDGMILEQGAQIEAIQNSSDSGADGDGYEDGYGDGDTDGDQPLFEEGDLSADGAGGNPPTGPAGDGSGTDDESTGGTSTARAGAGTTPGSGGKIPEDIPRGQDDDIVARQIREAAMQEQDPVLREKLWDEYRKYKNQQKAN